ncbi:ComF family protein [Rubripirellula lacrimiformis]|uniref:ComF family protein n=1 Tax=Rubripirellula lacrimiformis TaxID=1930273 RepID=UPI001C54D772|nr:phosphoribosyltransferase family protein [Rubripirellula lacrimiformis]
MKDTAAGARKAALELVLPPVCRLCNDSVAEDQDFCRTCDTALRFSETAMRTACRYCGLPRSVTVNPTSRTGGEEIAREEFSSGIDSNESTDADARCQECQTQQHHFDEVIALWSYRDRVTDAVVAAKYVHNAPLADALGRRLGDRVAAAVSDHPPDMVTFVPSHLSRQLTRGGNAIVTIAQRVAAPLRCPCRRLLRTSRRIAKQAWLDDQMRQKNVHGAFLVRKSYASPRSPQIANRHILVVDDVLTTGATANEVARVLKIGGASRITLAVVARAVRGR